ncbi:MAG: hypothetical protein IJ705_08250 [Oscillospiraceae bacterium]|nr:hypothetical protein [Oscillospiraceae bacterium]
MPSEKEITIIQKAAMYDLIQVLEERPDKAYTVEELKQIIKAYLTASESR